MKQIITLTAIFLISLSATSQNSSYLSAAVYNTQNAMPFGKFSGLLSDVVHPGMEVGFGNMFWQKSKHFWFLELKVGYFYHRYVQHGFPIELNFGYSHTVVKGFSLDTHIGVGYLHSIPETDKFKLNTNGEYKNNKGIGRMQAMASFGLGLEYKLKNTPSGPLIVFTNYEQRLQFPFVKSYVPLLPYNSLMLGMHFPIK